MASIRKKLAIADKAWKNILNKELSGFSIGAEVLLDHNVCSDDKCVSIVDKLNVYEISVCNTPTNARSNFSVITKSKANELGMDLCEGINKGSIDMETDGKPKEDVISNNDHKLEQIIDSLHSIKESINELKNLQAEAESEQDEEEEVGDIQEETDDDIKEILKSRDELIGKYESENEELKEQLTTRDVIIKELKSFRSVLLS